MKCIVWVVSFVKGFKGFSVSQCSFLWCMGEKKVPIAVSIGVFSLNRARDEPFAPGNLTFHGTGEQSHCVAPYEKWESVLIHPPSINLNCKVRYSV